VRAWLSNSRYRRDWALRTLHREVLQQRDGAVIAVLGLAYKENTHSTKNSPALALIRDLSPFTLQVYDPVVPPSAAAQPNLRGAETPLAACLGADAVVIMTPWRQFAALDPVSIAAAMAGRVVIDPFAVLADGACAAAGLAHFRLGRLAARRNDVAAHA
jgi:UDPglucose 6-dehydrogenase